MSRPLIMSFRPDAAEMCLIGRKTMARRIAHLNSWGHWESPDRNEGMFSLISDRSAPKHYNLINIRHNDRLLWTVGKSIAIIPHFTRRAIGRVMCTGLRVEHVQDITEEDARREGMAERCHDGPIGGQWALGPVGNFYNTWTRLYPTGPKSWEANPLVVVIEFRPLKEGES